MRRRSALNLACRSWALALSGVLVLRPATALAQAPPGPKQLAAALLPLPAELRSGAGVVTVDRHGQPHVWRPSANGTICIADTPGDTTFDVRCYQASFIPLVYRIRQLVAQGVADSAFDRTVDAEVRSGRPRDREGADGRVSHARSHRRLRLGAHRRERHDRRLAIGPRAVSHGCLDGAARERGWHPPLRHGLGYLLGPRHDHAAAPPLLTPGPNVEADAPGSSLRGHPGLGPARARANGGGAERHAPRVRQAVKGSGG